MDQVRRMKRESDEKQEGQAGLEGFVIIAVQKVR